MKHVISALLISSLVYSASSYSAAAPQKVPAAASSASYKETLEAQASQRAKDQAELSNLLKRRRGIVTLKRLICFRPKDVCRHKDAQSMGLNAEDFFGKIFLEVATLSLYDQNEKTPKNYNSSKFIHTGNKEYKVFNPNIHYDEKQSLGNKTPVGYESVECDKNHKHFMQQLA